MGKNVLVSERDREVEVEVWVTRVDELLGKKGMNQQELAQQCKLSPSVVSDWFGKNKKSALLREPRITGFQKVANCLGVSADYLLGADECETPSDEKIHKVTGLSGPAILRLKQEPSEKQLYALNYLIENMDETTLLESIFDYLFGKFSFPGKEDDMGAAFMVEYLPSGEKSQNITFKNVFSQASFVSVQEDLMAIKKELAKKVEEQCTEKENKE